MISPVAQSERPDLLQGSPFVSYVYSYPHKTAYRPLDPPVELSRAWADERRDALFLYLHVPFCEYRCGFCNLFTLTRPDANLPGRYLAQLRAQARSVMDAVGQSRFARLAVGGGTPTFLDERHLDELLDIAESTGASPREVPVSLEASPATLTSTKLRLLRQRGVDRLSLGVQSFNEADARTMGRPQRAAEVHAALDAIRAVGFPTLNVDLIYGGEGQTMASWLESLEQALRYAPEELYLYPIYVRPLTGLGRRGRDWDDWRLAAYREARELLLSRGYRQLSLRMFRAEHAPADDGPVYCCQQDGMIGLGCGARSYMRRLHYAGAYAVGQPAVAGILADYLRRDPDSFCRADHGIELNAEDRRRRYVILSLLQTDGLDRAQYQAAFGADPLADLPQLQELSKLGLATIAATAIQLTPTGLERSDAIGPWLFSDRVHHRMSTYQLR